MTSKSHLHGAEHTHLSRHPPAERAAARPPLLGRARGRDGARLLPHGGRLRGRHAAAGLPGLGNGPLELRQPEGQADRQPQRDRGLLHPEVSVAKNSAWELRAGIQSTHQSSYRQPQTVHSSEALPIQTIV